MLNKILYFQFKLIYKLLLAALLTIAVPTLYAAKVENIKSNNEPLELINNNANSFSDPPLDLLAPDTGDTLTLINPIPETEVLFISETTRSSKKYNNSFSKLLAAEYGDHTLVQESFNALYEVKQLWNQANAITYQFSYIALDALNLSQFVEDDLSYTSKSLTYQYDKIDNTTYDKIKRVQKSKKKNYGDSYHEPTHDFFFYLFRKQTLYYLLGFFFLATILQKLTKFLLRLFP